MAIFSVKFERVVKTYETCHRTIEAATLERAQEMADEIASDFNSDCPDDAAEVQGAAEFEGWSADASEDAEEGDEPDYIDAAVEGQTTYTILSGEGEMIETGLSLRDAADEILTSDGRGYDVREMAPNRDGSPAGYALWSMDRTRLHVWEETRFFSVNVDREAAELEIFEKVVTAERFPGHSEAITDKQYAEMLANLAEDGQ